MFGKLTAVCEVRAQVLDCEVERSKKEVRSKTAVANGCSVQDSKSLNFYRQERWDQPRKVESNTNAGAIPRPGDSDVATSDTYLKSHRQDGPGASELRVLQANN